MELTLIELLKAMPGPVAAITFIGLAVHWRSDIKSYVNKEWMELLKSNLEGRLQRIEDKLDKLNGKK